jgi:predicted RNA-binding Zn ribbon-like protein
MRPSEKFRVPGEIALLYDFVNSLDQRRYVEQGIAHSASDELATGSEFEAWLRDRGLLGSGVHLEAQDHRDALDLREALRSFLLTAPADRLADAAAGARLNAAAARFPLALNISQARGVAFEPARRASASGLGNVLAELYRLSETGKLDRLKLCDSDECRWMFYDHSKPANRRWCSSALCGNRQKTRDYRSRHRKAAGVADNV